MIESSESDHHFNYLTQYILCCPAHISGEVVAGQGADERVTGGAGRGGAGRGEEARFRPHGGHQARHWPALARPAYHMLPPRSVALTAGSNLNSSKVMLFTNSSTN